MSVVAKILVVLNLVLAIAFLGAAGTFLGAKETWKLKHEQLDASTKQQIATLEGNLKKTSDDLGKATATAERADAEAEGYKNRLELKEQEYKNVVERYNQLLAQNQSLTETYKEAVAINKQLGDDKDGLVNEKDEALTAARQAKEAENAAVTEQRRLESVLMDKDDQIGELEKRANALHEAKEKVEMVLGTYVEKFGPLPEVLAAPKITAKVSAVNSEMNIVILSVGRDDKVKEGYEFTIYRGGEYVGKVIVDRVEKDHCSGYSQKKLERSPITVGDNATTRF